MAAKTKAEKELERLNKAVEKLIKEYDALQKDFTKHVVTPDAHNPGVMAKRK